MRLAASAGRLDRHHIRNDLSLYDQVLDISMMMGAIPAR
jgi:hypothetical protein